MGIEENKRLVSDFFSHLGDADPSTAMSMLADDASWWIAGKPETSPGAGMKNKQQIEQLFRGMAGVFKDGMRVTVKGLIAESDKVAIEVQSYGALKNGRVYNNDYHVLVTVRDGKISALREYLDTQHVNSVFGP